MQFIHVRTQWFIFQIADADQGLIFKVVLERLFQVEELAVTSFILCKYGSVQLRQKLASRNNELSWPLVSGHNGITCQSEVPHLGKLTDCVNGSILGDRVVLDA